MRKMIDRVNDKTERAMYIEYSLLFKGYASRGDLMDAFGIPAPTATRDLLDYNSDTNNENCEFDEKTKTHKIKKTFKKKYPNTTEQNIQDWLKKEKIYSVDDNVTYRFGRINSPSWFDLIPLIRAMFNKTACEVDYFTLDKGLTRRYVMPHSLMDDGLKMYVRLYDIENTENKKGHFKTFALSRIKNTKPYLMLTESMKDGFKNNDNEWNELVDLILQPHPNLEHKETIEYEYRMSRGEKKIKVRSACAGYFLISWNVDCSDYSNLDCKKYPLCLKNLSDVKHIPSIKFLAPK
ncbi:hypothetical protein ACSWZC_003394 [Proteus mirabilis]